MRNKVSGLDGNGISTLGCDMRMRPSKSVRDEFKANSNLASLVLRGELDAARREAERIERLKRLREQRAVEYCHSKGIRYGG